MPQVRYHPDFEGQIRRLAQHAEQDDLLSDVFGEVSALLQALEDHGRAIEGDEPHDASHRVMSSRYELFALRRTPATTVTPYALGEPVVRIMYSWCEEADGAESAVVWLMGDKTELGNDRYRGVVPRIEGTMILQWNQRYPERRVKTRMQ